MRLQQLAVPGRGLRPQDAGTSGDAGPGGSSVATRGTGTGGDTLSAPVRPGRLRAPVPGRVFAAVTVAPALLAAAWLVPTTGLLLAGLMLPLPAVLAAGPLAVILCYFAFRGQPGTWPRPHLADPRPGGSRAGAPAGALVLMVAVATGFGGWQALLRSEPLFAS